MLLNIALFVATLLSPSSAPPLRTVEPPPPVEPPPVEPPPVEPPPVVHKDNLSYHNDCHDDDIRYILSTTAATASPSSHVRTSPPYPHQACVHVPKSIHRPSHRDGWLHPYAMLDNATSWLTARCAIPGSPRLPRVVDYRRAPDVVSPVKDQGQCGSCWAFSSAESLEGQLGLNGVPQNVSAQNFVDCVRLDAGCGGGWMDDALAYAEKHGVENDTVYPYVGVSDTCANNASEASIRPTFYVEVPKGDHALREALVVFGPVSIALDATFRFQSYTGGILTDDTCDPTMPDHALLLTGYNDVDGYWIVKNSWAASWGDGGYVYINNTVPNACGISSFATVPYIAPATPATRSLRALKHRQSIVAY